ncbi:hypothetical protein DSUL_160043 [Desulfovibrionales bacterium]
MFDYLLRTVTPSYSNTKAVYFLFVMNTYSALFLNDMNGAEGGTRTPMSSCPLPPQDSVSTGFTTSAKYITCYDAPVISIVIISHNIYQRICQP